MQPQRIAFAALLALVPACFEPDPAMMTAGEATDTEASSDTDPGVEPGSSTNSTEPPATTGDPMGGSSTGGPADSTGPMPPTGDSTGEDDEDIDFFDDFDVDRGQWVYEDDLAAQKEGPGNWRFSGGDLVQDSDISGPETASPSLGTYAIGGDTDWDAYLVEVAYTADDDGVAGVVCHVTEDGDFMRFDLDHETGIVRLVERVSGALSLVAEVEVFEVPMQLEVERTLAFECGDTYRGFVDGMLVIEGGASTNAEGGVGMYASSIGDGPAGLRFHELSVSDD